MKTSRLARRIPVRALGLSATVTMLVTAALVTPAAAASPTQQSPNAHAAKGKLDWGVKESFRDYIEGPVAQGHIDVFKPAIRKADGTFRYSKGKGSIDVEADTADVGFKGRVFFTGHGGALELWVSKPRLQLDGDDGILLVDTASRSSKTGKITTRTDVEFASLDLTGVDLEANAKDLVKATDIPAELTEDGASYFGGFYAAGTALDPVSFRVLVTG